MHMFPLGRVIYMPLSPTTTLLRPISTDFSSTPTIPLYRTTRLSNQFSFPTTTKFEYNALQQALPHRFKRIRDDLHDTQQKKRPRLSSTINTNDSSSALSKNALMLLHELKPSIEYKLVAQTGPSHRPIFTMAVELNGQIFEGMAQTKKEAKQAAAEKALRSFSELSGLLSDELVPTTAINTDNDRLNTPAENNNKNIQYNITESDVIQSDSSPLHLLNQLKPDTQFEEITDEIISERHEFKFAIVVDNQRFIGSGQSKEIAKTKAAEFALEKLFGMCFDKQENDRLPSNLPYSRRDFSDRIATCIQEKFNQLTLNDVRLQRRKVLSGIVLTHNSNLESMEIICITTGTKCLNNDHRVLPNGQSLNDCHAEILARRCLIRYCYEQLKMLIDGKSDQSIFEIINHTNRFRLKTSIDFHLYISTAPCGDSRLFSPHEIPSDLKNSLRKSRGLLRTKTTVTEGTIPVTIHQNIQTCDAERSSTMSCSDKLCQWNFIGLQGALLSTLIDPIYYTSIIIGSLYHSEHIRRALFARIDKRVNRMPTPYGLRRPFLSGVSNPEIRNTIRGPNHAFLWNCVDRKCEIIDTLTGLTIVGESSMVSKVALFQQWINLMKKIQSEAIPTRYHNAKKLAVNYQMAKAEISKAFQNAGLGLWIKKPHDDDEFALISSDVSALLPQTNESIPSPD